MTTQYPQQSWCGRCFTYPQGAVSFLPQILAAAAVYGSLAAFSTWVPLEDNWINHAPNFICLTIKTRLKPSRMLQEIEGGSDSSSSPTSNTVENDWSYGHECFPLTFHDQDYWDIDEDDTKWAWAIRLSCIIAIFVTIAGGLATVVLWSATCFALPPSTIQKIAGVFLACVPMALLTLIAGATSLCNRSFPSDDYPNIECRRNGTGVRLSYGGTTMIFVALFYLAACVATLAYRSAVINGETGEAGDSSTTTVGSSDKHHEVVPLVSQEQQQQHPVTCTTIKHTPDGTVTTKETTHPDGSKTVEIIDDDVMAPPGSPSRKSPRRTAGKKWNPKRESEAVSTPPFEEYL